MTSPLKNPPKHIAIIMDGNGRWATARGLPRILGHRAGAEAVRRIVEASCELDVSVLTLYAFSWENWDRPSAEIEMLMTLLDGFLAQEAPTLHANRIRLKAVGRLERLPQPVLGHLGALMEATSSYDRMTLTLALSYGGRQDIVDAARALADLARRGRLRPEAIDEAAFAAQLSTAGLPDPDLLIRTSGEQRLSNFLLWQSSYTELYMTPILWPDFSKADLLDAMTEYERRERRFGRTAAQPPSGWLQSDGRGGRPSAPAQELLR